MVAPPPITLRSVVLDCPDPAALAAFYAGLTGGRAVGTDAEWWEVHVGELPMKLAFQRVRHFQRPHWPDGAPQQLHLDLTVSDLNAACLHAGSLGATALGPPVEEPGCLFVVFADPVGHPFCLCQER
jgi:catechol 2,3-dioxygenase-like lactoylglutathione lyase family enzyme